MNSVELQVNQKHRFRENLLRIGNQRCVPYELYLLIKEVIRCLVLKRVFRNTKMIKTLGGDLFCDRKVGLSHMLADCLRMVLAEKYEIFEESE